MKKVFDSIHGFIYFNSIEEKLIDSFCFQRLHYLRQLGCAYLVYPGAVHTRFEHSFGVMELASQIFDKLLAHSHPFGSKFDPSYARQILRLAALAHDFGHLPFSHVAEKALIGEGGHEKWTMKILQSSLFDSLWDELKKRFPGTDPLTDVLKLAVDKETFEQSHLKATFSDGEKVLSQIITGNFFGADRIDYLLRDAKYSGLSYGVFDYHQLIEMLLILPCLDAKMNSWELGVEENGVESCEALLLARHFMHRRIYQYAKVKALAFHLSRFMKSFFENSSFEDGIDEYLSFTDNEVLAAILSATKDPLKKGHLDALALFFRPKRYRALQIDEEITSQKIDSIKKVHSIPDYALTYELSKAHPKKVGMDFPVKKRNGEVVSVKALSELSVPSDPPGWVYVAPEYFTLIT